MASEKQIAANRLNARHSTGPRSLQGKAVVSQNALKHGLRSAYFLRNLACGNADYLELHARLHEEWQPANPAEAVLVERMALALWKLAHLETVENKQLHDWGDYRALACIWPQQARLERAYDRAFTQLRAFRRERSADSCHDPVPAPPPPQPSAPERPPETIPPASSHPADQIGFVRPKNPQSPPPNSDPHRRRFLLTPRPGHSVSPPPLSPITACQPRQIVLNSLAPQRVARFDTRPRLVINV